MPDTATKGQNQRVPETPKHTIRVPDDLWQAALEKANSRYEKLTAVIIRGLVAYVEDE